jgi:3-mercaptopyruvate sulfurtransferase SseA
MLAACRAYWILTVMGCNNVHIMNGTFSKWKHEERETNFFESEDLWHKIAVDKKLRRRKFFGEDFETSFDE